MKLNDRLKWLKDQGRHPCISRRGSLWRAHVNGAGNFWHEDSTPLRALEGAVMIWQIAGRPMDGYADTAS